jgi:hypothetical protein
MLRNAKQRQHARHLWHVSSIFVVLPFERYKLRRSDNNLELHRISRIYSSPDLIINLISIYFNFVLLSVPPEAISCALMHKL